MVKGKTNFQFYHEWKRYLIDRTGEEVKQVLMSLIDYSENEIEPNGLNDACNVLFMCLSDQIKRDKAKYIEKCEKNQLNGRKGGRPSENRMVSEKTERLLENQTVLKKPDKDEDKDKDKDEDKDEDVYINIHAPNLEEFKNICLSTGKTFSNSELEYAFNYLQSNGWKKANGNEISDLSAYMKNWDKDMMKKPVKSKADQYNHFPQNKYDYDEIEKSMLSN